MVAFGMFLDFRWERRCSIYDVYALKVPFLGGTFSVELID